MMPLGLQIVALVAAYAMIRMMNGNDGDAA
jgi:hypothetical protein